MAEQNLRAGVIGLGAMGYQMARHLRAKGLAVAGYDVVPDLVAKAAELGVAVCGSAGSTPARTLPSRAASSTVVVIGPDTSWRTDSGTIPATLVRPIVGRYPTRLWWALGPMIEPQESVPRPAPANRRTRSPPSRARRASPASRGPDEHSSSRNRD